MSVTALSTTALSTTALSTTALSTTALSTTAEGAVVVVGALSGFLAGLTGSAGTYLALSLLTLALGDAHLAVGTTLVYALTLCVWGAVAHWRAGRFAPGIALAVGLPAAGTAVGGAWLAEQLPDRVLVTGVAVLTAGVLVAMLLDHDRAETGDDDAPPLTRATGAAAVPGGLALGLLQGMFGVGGGFLLLPFLVIALRVPTRLAVAAALLAGIPSLLTGAVSHVVLGNVEPVALGALLLGALPLAWLGARTTGRVTPATVHRAVVGLLSISCVALLAAG